MRRKPKYLREHAKERAAWMSKNMAQIEGIEERRRQAGLDPKTKVTMSEWNRIFSTKPWLREIDKARLMEGRVLDG
jgi:hypothetical protein